MQKHRTTTVLVSVLTVVLSAFAALSTLAVSAPAASAAAACTTSWKAPGTSGSFETAANWTAGIPTATSTACLPASATAYTVTTTANESALGLVVNSGATLRAFAPGAPGTVTALSVGSGGLTNMGTIELGGNLSGGTAATINVTGGYFQNQGLVHSIYSHGNIAKVNAILLNAATGTVQADIDTTIAGLGNDGVVVVHSGGYLHVPALANYNATTHTLGGGQYDVTGKLQIGSADITTLDSELDLESPTSQVLDGTGVNALQHLATVTANGTLSLGANYVMNTPAFTNNGRVLVGNTAQFTSAGTYTQQGSYYTSIGSGAEFTAAGASVVVKSGYLLGDGFVGPAVLNTGGVVAPAQHLIVSGNYTQQAGGTLSTRVGGAATYDFYVGGTASLAGTLAVAANSDLTPQQGQSFTAMRANARTGNFTTITSDGLKAPLAFEMGSSTPNVTVYIVSKYDDVDSHVQYNGWQAVTGNGGSANSIHASKTAGDTATFRFTGTAVTWSTGHTTESGIAQVLIDGVNKGTFDLYAAKNVAFPQTFSGLTNAAHTLVVKVLGTKNVASTSTFVIVDNFTVGTTVTEDNGRAIQWNSWTGITSGTNGYFATTTAGATASAVSVVGSSIDWVTRTGPDQGMAQLLLDGTVVKTVDLYAAAAHTGVRYSVPLTTGYHTITVKALGTKNAASSAATITVDGFVVH